MRKTEERRKKRIKRREQGGEKEQKTKKNKPLDGHNTPKLFLLTQTNAYPMTCLLSSVYEDNPQRELSPCSPPPIEQCFFFFSPGEGMVSLFKIDEEKEKKEKEKERKTGMMEIKKTKTKQNQHPLLLFSLSLFTSPSPQKWQTKKKNTFFKNARLHFIGSNNDWNVYKN